MGKVANRYKGREKRVFSEKAKLRFAIRKTLRAALVEATDTELYKVTKLPVTKAMRRSINTRSDDNTISVLYKLDVAPHAEIRLKKTGISKLGGHKMDMNPGAFIERNAYDKIMAMAGGALKRVFG